MSQDYQAPSGAGRPITPPPELVEQWRNQAPWDPAPASLEHAASIRQCWIATQAAHWGADQELEACVEWMVNHFHGMKDWAAELRAARRPKPPSLKEQALAAHGEEPSPETGPTGDTILNAGAIERHRLIRRALERLQELEGNG